MDIDNGVMTGGWEYKGFNGNGENTINFFK